MRSLVATHERAFCLFLAGKLWLLADTELHDTVDTGNAVRCADSAAHVVCLFFMINGAVCKKSI